MHFPLFIAFPLYRKFRENRLDLEEIISKPLDDKFPDYTIVVSIGNEEDTIQNCLDGILNQTVAPRKIILFVESKDNTLKKIKEKLREYPYKSSEKNRIEDFLSEEEFGWNKIVLVEYIKHESKYYPTIELFISKGENLGKGLSINWLVKYGYIDTKYFLQIDADVVPEPQLAEKLLKTISTDDKIAAVYAFSYEVPEKDTLESKIIADAYNIYKRIAHVIFRLSWNYWDFHYTLEGPHVMFNTEIYWEIPRPLDTLAGDTSHAWELQRRGYRVLSNIYALDIVREVSSFKQLYKQRMKWNSGPLQNLLIRGKQTLEDLIRARKAKTIFQIIYHTIISPAYQTFWLYGPLVLNALDLWTTRHIIEFYTIDASLHLASALYSTRYLREIHKIYRNENAPEFLRRFFLYYFIFRPVVSFTYAIAYSKTLYEWFIKRKRKWFLMS